ncbi:MAG: DUF4440 domain-containing protein [Actinomycetota bacterium]
MSNDGSTTDPAAAGAGDANADVEAGPTGGRLGPDEAVAAEIVALHVEFDRWFDGESPSLERVERTLAADFLFVAPSGAVLVRDAVLAGLADARRTGSRHIRIEHPTVRWRRGEVITATYEEWQSLPGDGGETARLSTVVMEADLDAPAGLRWLAVHETWLHPPPTAR